MIIENPEALKSWLTAVLAPCSDLCTDINGTGFPMKIAGSAAGALTRRKPNPGAERER
jgi:hypothetical protein